MAAGQITTGFSKPYVALYGISNGAITYTGGMVLARGVNVNVEPETSDDNNFYGDNIVAEKDAGKFSTGTLTLTVDGLKIAAEKMIMGIPDPDTDGWTSYDDDQAIPEVGVGFIRRTREAGVDYYIPYVLTRVTFNQIPVSANTQEESIDWQTTELSGKIDRAEDAKHTWRCIGDRVSIEAAAEAALREKLGITTSG